MANGQGSHDERQPQPTVSSTSVPAEPEAANVGSALVRRFLDQAGQWVKLISVLGIPLYVALWAGASAFYGRLGVDPQEIGLNYGTILIKSWGQLFFLLLAALYLYFLVDRLHRRGRRTAKRVTIGLFVVLVIAWWSSLILLAVTRSSDAQKGILHRTSLLFVTFMPWSVWPATVEPADASPPPELAAVTGDCLVYLGRAEGITVLYDVDRHASLRIPSGQLILDVQSPGERPKCPDS